MIILVNGKPYIPLVNKFEQIQKIEQIEKIIKPPPSIYCYTTFADGYERHMRMFLNYYLQFCDKIFVVYDTRENKTCEFLDSYNNPKIIYKVFNLRGETDCFQESAKLSAIYFYYWPENTNADWNIAVDCDEYIYSPYKNISISQFLSQEHQGDYFVCKGFNVGTSNENNNEFFDSMPSIETLRYSPTSAYNKPSISRRSVCLKYSDGFHALADYTNLSQCRLSPVLLHTKYLNKTYLSNVDKILLSGGKPGSDGRYEHQRNIYADEVFKISSAIITGGTDSCNVFT